MPQPEPPIRALKLSDHNEINLVAERMRQTLVGVLGHERGYNMYSIEWLVERVNFHLDPSREDRAVFVFETNSEILGHTIVRVEHDDQGRPFGLFSTIYVTPESRRAGIACALISVGESWMTNLGLPFCRTYTDEHNTPLINLFQRTGYTVVEVKKEFAVLQKPLAEPFASPHQTP